MRFTLGPLLVLTVAMTACQAVVPAKSDPVAPLTRPLERPAGKASASVAPPTGPVTAGASASPSASPSAAPSAAPVLQKPGGAIRVLTGTVSIDAHYAAKAGGGRIVGNNGAQTIAFGDAALIGNNGGNIISDNGASLIGKVKAPVAGLVSHNGAGYRLAQTVGGTVAVGEALPAAGMAIRAFSLRTGEILSLGEDAAGKPVYEVYSDAAGQYQVYLPETAIDNVLLQAFVPTRTDKRLDLRLVVAEQQNTPAVDEDSALVSDNIRRAFTNNMVADLTIFAESATVEAAVVKDTEIYSAVFREPLMTMRRKLFTAAEKAGVKAYSPERRRVLAQRITDAALSHMDLNAIQTNFALQKLTRAEEPAIAAQIKILQEARLRIRDHMRQLVAKGEDIEAHYAKDEVVTAVNAKVSPPFVIRTPAEAVEFFIHGVYANPAIFGPDQHALFVRMQTDPEYQFGGDTLALIRGATKPVEEAYIKTFYLNEEAAKDAVAAIAAGVP